MSYYGYHQKIKQRIRNGEMIDCYLDNQYKQIGTALVLVFKTNPFKRPIRQYRWPEYAQILKEVSNSCPGAKEALPFMIQSFAH